MRVYPDVERNGLVWAWHHAEDGEPFYDVPEVPEFDDPELAARRTCIEFRIATSCQEMAENNHDYAHFKFVHGTDAIPDGAGGHRGHLQARREPRARAARPSASGSACCACPGIVTFLSSVTPIDTENVHVRWAFTAPATEPTSGRHVDGRRVAPVSEPPSAREAFAEGVSQDIPIWENKIYRERPVLTKGESGIVAHRKLGGAVLQLTSAQPSAWYLCRVLVPEHLLEPFSQRGLRCGRRDRGSS